MTGDAGHRENASRARRPGRPILVVLAVLLLLGGATALTLGILGQDAAPPSPAAATRADPPTPEPTTPEPSTSGAVPAPEPPAQDAGPPASATPTSTRAAALPVWVSIPAIDVRSDLITVGLNPDGTLEVPQPGPDYDKAAWFRDSPRPGDVGPAVIEGYVDSAANGPSVFYRLGDLAPGDRIDVGREDGTVASFVVDEVRVFPKDDFPTLAVYGNTERPELRLITCGGPFDRVVRNYLDNVVVFASLDAP